MLNGKFGANLNSLSYGRPKGSPLDFYPLEPPLGDLTWELPTALDFCIRRSPLGTPWRMAWEVAGGSHLRRRSCLSWEETSRKPWNWGSGKGLERARTLTVEVESWGLALQWAVEPGNGREEHEFGFGYVYKSLMPSFSFGCQMLGVGEGCVGYVGHESAKQATVSFVVFFFPPLLHGLQFSELYHVFLTSD